MISRLFTDRRNIAVLRRIDRPSAALLAVVQAIVATVGWFVEPTWLAVAVAVQLALGGIGAVWVIGPARGELGLARYAIPAVAGISATIFGRVIPGGLSLLLVPIAAVLLWSVTYLELRVVRGEGGRTLQVVLFTAITFAAAWGLFDLFGAQTWPTPVALLAVLVLPLALRASEARGTIGAEGVGQALLHILVVTQIAAATVLLLMPLYAMASLIAFAFYIWAGAVDALRGGASGRSVAIEYGALSLVGLVAGLLLHRP